MTDHTCLGCPYLRRDGSSWWCALLRHALGSYHPTGDPIPSDDCSHRTAWLSDRED